MVNQQLLDYIKQQLSQGANGDQIKNSLTANGWQAQDVDEAFSLASNPSNQPQPVPPPAPAIPSLPGATEIFSQAWTIYKQRLGTFLGILIIPILSAAAVLAIFSGSLVSSIFLFFSKFSLAGIGLFILLAILFFIINFTGQIWGQTALLYAIKDSQEKIGVVESYRRGWRKIISYWWVSLLVGLITTGGFFLLVVPGIIFSIWFSLATFILIAEDLTGMKALLKSREYVRGKWGSIFWRFLFINGLSLVASAPIFIFSFLKIPFTEEASRFIIGLFLTPLVTTYSFLIYSNLRALKGEIVFASAKGKKVALILISIIGILIIPAILSSIVLSSLGSAREKARDARRQADIMQIRTGLEIYYMDHNSYPFSLNELSPAILPSMKVDPSTNQPYQYQLQPNGTDYKVCAQLESTKAQKCVGSQF